MRRIVAFVAIVISLTGCGGAPAGGTSQQASPSSQPVAVAAETAPPATATITPTSTPAPTATPYRFSTKTKPVWKTRRLEDSELVPLTMESCTREPELFSENGVQETFLRIKNAATQPIKVIWINYSGKRDLSPEQQNTLQPNGELDISTFVTHPFIVLDATEQCLGIALPAPQPGLVTIEGS